MSAPRRIHALPGMGADHRLYPDPWGRLPGLRAHDWPAYRNERSIEAVARSCCEAWEVADGDVLVGSSLGGMVACEIARVRRIERLYLLGSALHPSEIRRSIAFAHRLAAIAPMSLIWWAAGKLPPEVASMFAAADPRFVRAMCRAVFTWPGWQGASPVPVRLHGRRDRLIPPPQKADLLVDSGHLIAFTRPQICASFIETDLNSLPLAH